MGYIGDLFQLPPVKGEPVYQRNRVQPGVPLKHCDISGEEIWFNAMNSVILLDRNFRQQDAAFLNVCRAVRSGHVTRDHLDTLNERAISPSNMPPTNALYIYPYNKQVLAMNIIMVHHHAQKNNLPVIRLLAQVSTSKTNPQFIQDEAHAVFSGFTLGKPTRDNCREGLVPMLDLHFGAPVILIAITNDLQAKYHIGNNTTGTFVGCWPPSSNQHFTGPRNVSLVDDNTNGTVYYPAAGHEVTHLLIKIDTPAKKSFQMPNLPPNVYALPRKKTTAKGQDGRTHAMAQFPIRLFYSSTGDKVQGASLSRPVVLGAMNNGRTNFLYVVITRVLRLAQLYLARKLTTQDMAYCGPSVSLRIEMERLALKEAETIHRIRTCPRMAGL
jgi:hypothetical protein